MSRSSRTAAHNSAMSAANHSQQDRDIVMGPPPLPPQIALSNSGDSRGREREGLDLADKYKKLKRKYFELEEKHKDVAVELRGSGERSVKLRNENALLRDRIVELEALQSNAILHPEYPCPLSTAYPRALLSTAAQKRFIGNLERAMSEAEVEDPVADPLLQSKHVGPAVRKRIEAEQKERLEEEQSQARKTTRRPRGGRGGKDKELVIVEHTPHKQAGPSGTRSTRASEREAAARETAREKEVQRERERVERSDRDREPPGPPLTLAPAPSSRRERELSDEDSPPLSQQVLTSSSGTRLRIKPPAPPASPRQQPRAVSPPAPSSGRRTRSAYETQPHYHAQPRHDYDDEPHGSPATQRYDPREEFIEPERDDMDVDREDDRPLPLLQQQPVFSFPPPPPPPSLVPLHPQSPVQARVPPHADVHSPSRPSPPDFRAEPPMTSLAPAVAPPRAASPRPAAAESPRASVHSEAAGPARSGRKRSDSPGSVFEGGHAGAQAAMMGQIVLSPPAPYRLTPIDPVPAPPSMQMTFRTSPATHVSTYGHSRTSQSPRPPKESPNPNKQHQAQPQSTPSPNIDPQLYRTQPSSSVSAFSGILSPALSDLGASQPPMQFGNGSASGTSSLAGTPGIGPGPGPITLVTPPNSLPTPLNTMPAPGTPVPSAGAGGSRGKPKRLKAHTVTSKSYSIPMVPRDKAGKPLLPLNVGIMTVLNLGEVCMREHFHTERYIFPVGYEVTRRYLSTTDANAEAVYHCTILDGGDGPKFQIVATDQPDKPVIAGTATGAWSVIVRTANHVRNRQHSNSVSGPDFFGLGQNTIKHLIQELPGADRLKDYVWQNFVEGGPLGGRHAAVIPALPDDQHDPNSEPTDANGVPTSMTGMIAMTPAPPSPSPTFFVNTQPAEEAKEFQIIQVDNPSGNGHHHASNGAAHMGMLGGPMKPLQFQQEFPQRFHQKSREDAEKAEANGHGHGRRGSVTYANEEYERGRAQTHRSPGPQRTASHSPSMHRSPYQTPTIPQHGSPQVPPTFASIMHAYPAPPGSASSPYDGASANGRTR